MGCKNNCAGCSDTLVGNTQKSMVAWIQPCGAGPRNDTYSAMTDGDWPAVKVTGKSRQWRGARTPQWRRNSDGTSQICHVTEAVPGDNTITLEFADCGCGGYSPDELSEQNSFDLYEMQRCCGLADLASGWSKMKVTRCISFSGVDESPSTSYDTSEDGDLTRTYTGGLFVSAYTVYPLTFGEVAVATGFDVGARIPSFTYANNRAGCSTSCKDQCADAWYAVTDEGLVIYKIGKDYPISSSAIPGFTQSFSTRIIHVGDALIVPTLFGYWRSALDSLGQPTTWAFTNLGASFIPDGVTALSNNSAVTYGMINATSNGVIYKFDQTGAYTTLYYSGVANTNVVGYSECGNVAIAGLVTGEVLHTIGQCGTLSATTVAPSAVALVDVAIQPGGIYWAMTETALYYSGDSGETWNTVTLPGAAPTQLRKIIWVDAGIGYIISGTELYTTLDGGVTWTTEDTGARINAAPVDAVFMLDIQTPCCKSLTATANAVAISGLQTGNIGAIWLGGVQTC